MQPLGESWDVVDVVRSLVTEVDSLQKIVAAQEARLQVLEGGPRPLLQVGTPVAEDQPARRVRKGQAGGGGEA
jgi:hypothetical protein